MSIFFDIMYLGDIMNQNKFLEFRSKYPFFYYKDYNVEENDKANVVNINI